jgi:hypothetical protein
MFSVLWPVRRLHAVVEGLHRPLGRVPAAD